MLTFGTEDAGNGYKVNAQMILYDSPRAFTASFYPSWYVSFSCVRFLLPDTHPRRSDCRTEFEPDNDTHTQVYDQQTPLPTAIYPGGLTPVATERLETRPP